MMAFVGAVVNIRLLLKAGNFSDMITTCVALVSDWTLHAVRMLQDS